MIISLFPLMDVISQIKAYSYSVSMENQAVRLGCLSKTQNNALNQKLPQNNQLEALNFLHGRNKMACMKNSYKLKPVWKMLTTDGLFLSHHVCLGSWFCYYLSVSGPREKRQVKIGQELNFSIQKYRVTMPVYEFKCNDECNYNDLNLHFYNSFEVSIEKLCHKSNNDRKGNITSKIKEMISISKIRMCKCSLDMLPICICPFTATGKIRTANSCICLTPHILLFLTVKELSDSVLAVYNKISKELLGSVWVEAYLFPITKNLWNQVIKFTLHLVIAFNIVYYNVGLLHIYVFNKEKEHKSHPWLLLACVQS